MEILGLSANELFNSSTIKQSLRSNVHSRKNNLHVSAVWLLVLIISLEGKAAETTCENRGLREPARVTCHFDQNVVKARDVSAVLLQRLPLNGTDGKQEMVVECRRFRNEEFDCLVETDYTINGTLSDQLITNIHRAQPEHQGKYYCIIVRLQVVIQGDSCDLEYKARDHSTQSAPPSEPKRDDHLNGDTGTSHVSAPLIANTALILVLLVIAVVLFICLILQPRRFRRQQDADLDRITDKSVRLFLASNTDDGNGPRKMDFSRFSYKHTEV